MTADALGELVEERDHDLLELGRLDHVEDLFELVQKHHLLRGMHLQTESGKYSNIRLI